MRSLVTKRNAVGRNCGGIKSVLPDLILRMIMFVAGRPSIRGRSGIESACALANQVSHTSIPICKYAEV